jgi:hypothetical protein
MKITTSGLGMVDLNSADKIRALADGPPMAGPAQGGQGFIKMGATPKRTDPWEVRCDFCGRSDRLIQSAGHDRRACWACLTAQEAHSAGLARMTR